MSDRLSGEALRDARHAIEQAALWNKAPGRERPETVGAWLDKAAAALAAAEAPGRVAAECVLQTPWCETHATYHPFAAAAPTPSEPVARCGVCGHVWDEHNAAGCGFSVGDDDVFCFCSATPGARDE